MKNLVSSDDLDRAIINGGSKAKRDVVNFLKKENFTSLPIKRFKFKNIINWPNVFFKASKYLKKEKPEILLLQYPMDFFVLKKFLLTAKKSSDALVIVLVHDIESVRYEHYLKLQDELKIFNAVDGLIVLNSKMNVWLKKHGVVVPMVNLEIWDYDNSNCFSEFSRYKRSICFAGSLDKSVFLNNINLKHKMYVFGTNPRHDYPECIEYMGSYSAEILPAHLNYNFGLVWDGTSVETCDGLMGEYLKINNPHKTSLYLSSGIPVIIWARAALADFVLKNKIGLTINSLSELDEKIDSISELEYENMHQNAVNIGKRMRDGYYIKKAVSQYTPAILRFK